MLLGTKSRLLLTLSTLAFQTFGTLSGPAQALVLPAPLANDLQYLRQCEYILLETDLKVLERIALDVNHPCREIALARFIQLCPPGMDPFMKLADADGDDDPH